MISSLVSRSSALVLLAAGLALLFAPDAIMPRLDPAFPPSAAWIAQLLAAAWIAVAIYTWSHRTQVLGGIYGRAVVYANFVLFFIGGLGLLGAARHGGASPALWWVAVPMLVFAVVYGALLFRGPFDQLRA